MSPKYDAKYEPKVEEKTEEVPVIPVKKEPVQSREKISQPANILVSDLDAFILDRVKSQPQTLGEVDVQVVERPADGRHRLSLPEELESYRKKYAFFWIFKRKQAVDEACDQYHWILVNRTHFPDLPDYLFSARGVMERGDNILAFRTLSIDAEMRKAPGIESQQRLEARFKAHEGDPNYYKPADEIEKDPITGKSIKSPVVGV